MTDHFIVTVPGMGIFAPDQCREKNGGVKLGEKSCLNEGVEEKRQIALKNKRKNWENGEKYTRL
jgi:hypothetical protein